MTQLIIRSITLACLFAALSISGAFAAQPSSPAIVVAAFGTTYPDTLDALLGITEEIEKTYP